MDTECLGGKREGGIEKHHLQVLGYSWMGGISFVVLVHSRVTIDNVLCISLLKKKPRRQDFG